jgi:hypothetical protein
MASKHIPREMDENRRREKRRSEGKKRKRCSKAIAGFDDVSSTNQKPIIAFGAFLYFPHFPSFCCCLPHHHTHIHPPTTSRSHSVAYDHCSLTRVMPRSSTFQSLCMLVVVACIASHVAGAVTFYLSEGTKKCFLEDLPRDTLVVAALRASDIAEGEGVPEGVYRRHNIETIGITGTATGPNQEVVFQRTFGEVGRLAFTSKLAGEHEICFQSNSTRWFGSGALVLLRKLNAITSFNTQFGTDATCHLNSARCCVVIYHCCSGVWLVGCSATVVYHSVRKSNWISKPVPKQRTMRISLKPSTFLVRITSFTVVTASPPGF